MKTLALSLVLLLVASISSAQVLSRPPANLKSIAQPVLDRVTAADRDRFMCAHSGRPCQADWIKAVAWELHKVDPRFGLNGKRGNENDLSLDVVVYLLDPNNRRMVAAWDICGNCGASNQTAEFGGEMTDYATIGRAGTAIYVKPEPVGDTGGGGGGGGGITPTPPIDLSAVLAKLDALAAKLDGVSTVAIEARDLAARAAADAGSAAHDAREINSRPAPVPVLTVPCLTGRVPKAFGGSTEVTFCPPQ